MRAGNFSVMIEGGLEKTNGQVQIDHGRKYKIKLGNHQGKRCDAILTIDGRHIADFRLDANQVMTIEGPPSGDRGCFTFLEADTDDAADAGVSEVRHSNRGLIQVRFKPEYKLALPAGVRWAQQDEEDPGKYRVDRRFPKPYFTSAPQPDHGPTQETSADVDAGEVRTSGNLLRGMSCSAPPRTKAGITGLTGQTDQNWTDAAQIDHDPSGEVVITLRLVGVPIEEIRKVRPLKRLETPVPPQADR